MVNEETYHNVEKVKCRVYVGDKTLDPQQLDKDGISEKTIHGNPYIAHLPRCTIRYHIADIEGHNQVKKKKVGPTDFIYNDSFVPWFGSTTYNENEWITINYTFSSRNLVKCTIAKFQEGFSHLRCDKRE